MPLVILSPEISISETARIIEAGVRDVIRIPAAPEEVLARAAVRAKRSVPKALDQRLIGESPAMDRARREIFAVSALDSTVLVTGETGTGKGLAARLLHDRSPRRHRAFVHADCSGLTGSLIESELFGHERGAFTGAFASRAGRFEAAAGGTLFLDEIGELSLALQAKLLRVLQDQVYEKVGSNQPRVMSARIVAATNRDLETEVSAGRFRQDLFFRLNVIRIKMPPLRDRPEDLAILVRTLLQRLADRLRIGVPAVPKALMSELVRHEWPGNVRELMNVLERFLVQYHAGLLDVSLPNRLIGRPASAPTRVDSRIRAFPRSDAAEEKRFLETELAAAGGNIARLARKLGVPRSTLRYRISLHDIAR
ncbi:MAG: sigma-54-dependent Fis family transcriptional regulator [Deltaproteobacteria bacterium]|nr:sigma-54-dependent Fis family transcriptional regulator [Deltaproteobacteria bacterium]